MKAFSPATVMVFLAVAPASAPADLALVARYDWMDDARDVSGSPVPHDGVLDPGVTAEGGRLRTFECSGVVLGDMEELQGATEVLVRFEDLTFTDLPAGEFGQYSALAGGGVEYAIQWWAAVKFHGNRTTLRFNLGGWDWGGSDCVQEVEVVVAERVVNHFDSIEFRFDGSAPPEERIGFRWNDGPWWTAGWSDPWIFPVFPEARDVHINYGCQANWDYLDATLGPVSFHVGSATAGGRQRPGDGTGDGVLDLSDAVFLLEHLFLGQHEVLPCGAGGGLREPGNIALLDSNGDAAVDLSDAVQVLMHLFLGGSPPVLGIACVPIPTCPEACI